MAFAAQSRWGQVLVGTSTEFGGAEQTTALVRRSSLSNAGRVPSKSTPSGVTRWASRPSPRVPKGIENIDAPPAMKGGSASAPARRTICCAVCQACEADSNHCV
eukprot:5422981-Lingulodinium_polyedra.AAC.1